MKKASALAWLRSDISSCSSSSKCAVVFNKPKHHVMFCLQDTASEDYINKLGNLLAGEDGRRPPASAEKGDNALAEDPAGGNAVGEEVGKHGGQDKGGRVGEAQHLNRVDHEDTSAWDGNGLGFLVSEWRGVFCSARKTRLAPNLLSVRVALGLHGEQCR